ncbi:MAG: histidine--tRNA ligase [Betaproteobacteria bacterium]|nr:histidine--tRNA ligase [Betaproteobacteria bacterium]MBU6513143.1 histidine--tRNA ligase [Betaproteobacteria bacterium]MDE1955585.1 histidine--tRNA ligase [Betaproteobacteria bacterium]MDE2153040.1 histidine--tRNA ligase [Betaproteobacteria bacterium]MDE2478182.1 histidine--tRNA ligase [Betaproteobacteria bacterium]
MTSKLSAVKGMNDILPPESARWEWFESQVRELMRAYGYRNVRTPIVEPTPLFVRGIGEVTDIVEKEMYSFTDSLNGEALTLRPENTASLVRATIEHNLLYDGGKRLWYTGPMFRHERPQRGRYRQFHQVGAEALGFAGPDVDAELILMVRRLWTMLGLHGLRLEINCLGQAPERASHRAKLIAYFEAHAAQLDEDARRRLHSNPLRILDTKNPAMQELVQGAPRLLDELGEESRAHFEGLQALLRAAGQDFVVNPRLVRGLDYYNLSVFEWVSDQLGAQGTVCAGGRYDGLIEQIGGKPAPACGWALGIERVLDLLAQAERQPQAPAPDAYVVLAYAPALPRALQVAEELRAAGLAVLMHAGGGSLKSQMKKADASGARHALIFGEAEWLAGEVGVKSLRAGGEQQQRSVALQPASLLIDGLTGA